MTTSEFYFLFFLPYSECLLAVEAENELCTYLLVLPPSSSLGIEILAVRATDLFLLIMENGKDANGNYLDKS